MANILTFPNCLQRNGAPIGIELMDRFGLLGLN